MPTCVKCNTYNNLEQLHCKKCQAILPVDVENSCPRCSAKYGPYAKNCRNCNYNLKQSNPKKTLVSKLNDRKPTIPAESANIKFRCEVDDFTKQTLFENYAILAKELNVYPKVIIHKRGTYLPGGQVGYYNFSSGEIEIVDMYYLISALAHEMRHAYQHVHMPKLFYKTRITNAYEYISSPIEVDAREFAIDYCKRRDYTEEMNVLINQERDFKLFLNGKLSASAVGLDENYYENNPIDLQSAPQKSFKYNQRPFQQENDTYKSANSNKPKNTSAKVTKYKKGKSKLLIIELILLGLIGAIVFFTGGLFQENLSVFAALALIIHLVFSLIYIVKNLFNFGFVEAIKTSFKHVLILLFIFVAFILIDTEREVSSEDAVQTTATTSNPAEFEYEDLLRNADGAYKNEYIKVSGVVYHLEDGQQKHIMINTSNDPYKTQAIYVERNEQDETIILDDHVVIYGLVAGTIPVAYSDGTQSAVPMIESQSLILTEN